jgi:TRAP-type C4-dicarboxylate transport system substrate-binding protein
MRTLIAWLVVGSWSLVASQGWRVHGSFQNDERATTGSERITLRYASGFPATSPYEVEGSKFWMKRVTALTNGRVQFEYYPAGQLAKPDKQLSLTSSGVADVAMVAANTEADKFPLVGMVELPGIYTASCPGTAAYNSLLRPGKAIADVELKNRRYRMLFFVLQPVARISMATKSLASPADLRGQKIRVAGGAQSLTISALGGAPVRMSAGDAVQAISRGTVDGILVSWNSLRTFGLVPMVKTTIAGMGFGGAALGVSFHQATWARLPPDVQASITQASADTTAHLCRHLEHEDARTAKLMQERGVTMTTPSDRDRAAFQTALEPIAGEWIRRLERRGLPARRALDEFKAALSAPPKGAAE